MIDKLDKTDSFLYHQMSQFKNELDSIFYTLLLNVIESVMEVHVRNVHTSTFSDKIEIFPEGTIFYSNSLDLDCFVVEQKPQIRTLFVDENPNLLKNKYRLAFPYIYFIISVKDSKKNCYAESPVNIGWRNTPLTSLDDLIYLVAMPNINDFEVCITDFYTPQKSVIQVVNYVVSEFWNQSLGSDWNGNLINAIARDRFFDFENWEKTSKTDPFAILNVNYGEGTPLIKKLIRQNATATNIYHSFTKLTNDKIVALYSKARELIVSKFELERQQIFNRFKEKMDEFFRTSLPV